MLQLKKEGKKYSSLLKHPTLCFRTSLLYFLLGFMSCDCPFCMFVVSVSPIGMCTLWCWDLIFLSLLFTNAPVLCCGWSIHLNESVNGWMKSLGPPLQGRLTQENFPASTSMGFGFLICKMGDLPSAYGISVETCVLPPSLISVISQKAFSSAFASAFHTAPHPPPPTVSPVGCLCDCPLPDGDYIVFMEGSWP